MADTAETRTSAITDRRPTPRGVLPAGAQTWLMGGLALGIVLIILFTGRSEPHKRVSTTGPPAPLAPAAERLRDLDLQGQLKALEDRTRQQAAEASAAEARTSPTATIAAAPVAPAAQAPDPLLEERRRRDYDSLFASNIVASRRQPLEGTAGSRRVLNDGGGSPARLPSLDETAEAVVRASARVNQPTGSPLPAAPPMPVSPFPAPSQTGSQAVAGGEVPPRSFTYPGSTGAIDPSGPLHRLLEGTVIDAVLVNRLDGSSASPVVALVAEPRYSHSGNAIVIPAGARVLGETKPVQNVGETRLAVGFHRVIFPDGSSRSLDQFKGLNQVGDNALHDQVNQHYLSTFGAAAAVGLVSGLTQYLGNSGFGAGENRIVVVASGVGNETNQAVTTVLSRFLNRLPTVTIREGTRIKIYLTGDVDLPAYAFPSDVRPSGATVR